MNKTWIIKSRGKGNAKPYYAEFEIKEDGSAILISGTDYRGDVMSPQTFRNASHLCTIVTGHSLPYKKIYWKDNENKTLADDFTQDTVLHSPPNIVTTVDMQSVHITLDTESEDVHLSHTSSNERTTEEMVRTVFREEAKTGKIILEEQMSDDPKIRKLLELASKSGTGCGKPEFLIRYINVPNFIVVVECKGEVSKHVSINRDNPKDFAVDGVIHYSSYLSEGFNVLGLAVSGTSKSNMRVSHFLQMRGSVECREINNQTISSMLSPDDYLSMYMDDKEKQEADYGSLSKFLSEFNEILHSHNVKEDRKGLLYATIVVALENDVFRNSYSQIDDSCELCVHLFDTTLRQLPKSGKDVFSTELGFIKNAPKLSTEPGVLKELIVLIDEHIAPYKKTNRYRDIIGACYVEFMSYANGDKSLGIVLTPHHIAEFMAKVAGISKDSTVYDNCCGTAGLIVAAMNVMIENSGSDSSKIDSVKKSQLIGTELQPIIYTLASANMVLRNNCSNVISIGDCFDPKIISKVKQQKPTIGLLNPPFGGKLTKHPGEFVLNNLECLSDGGKCAAILPMTTVIGMDKDNIDFRRRLMEQHTLEAVFSMPNEIFIDSKVGTVVSIMIVTSKRPHPNGKKVFFGYFKDDGFIKKKNLGRIDYYNKFTLIRAKWINAFFNREEIDGLTITKEVKYDDEWCAEAYMKTNYNHLTCGDFSKTVKDYAAFMIKNNLI
jgi:type I restriction-modification system DNA methylase subunit